jgi:hypothetical protein
MTPAAKKKAPAKRKSAAKKKAATKRPMKKSTKLAGSGQTDVHKIADQPWNFNKRITPKMLRAWSLWLCGFGYTDIGKEIGVDRNTATRYINTIRKVAEIEFDPEHIRKGMKAMLPDALCGLVVAFGQGNAAAIKEYLTQMKVYNNNPDINLGGVNINLQQIREQNQKEGFAKLGVVVRDSD